MACPKCFFIRKYKHNHLITNQKVSGRFNCYSKFKKNKFETIIINFSFFLGNFASIYVNPFQNILHVSFDIKKIKLKIKLKFF